MTIDELEEAKLSLRLTLETQKGAMTISKEDLSLFVQYQSAFWKKWDVTDEDKKLLVSYLENYVFVKHDHDGYAIISDEPFDNTWYTKNPPKNQYFWNLFSRYHAQKGDLDRASLTKLGDKTLPALMNCLGNPTESLNNQRKRYGLVLGDVQSGKTSTYAGLICKAADAGMKVVILLAGVTETLRKQTQERIEKDIVGLTISSDYFNNTKTKPVGVGTLDGWENKVTAYTIYDEDFNISRAKTMSSIDATKSIVLFVVKKNVPVLTHLRDWLTGPNQKLNKEQKLPYSLLLIDDEADNASINTKDSSIDPTATNRIIREICEVFMNSNYVGFTATPYANVFINPVDDNEMIASDLFPKDFIYVLPTPDSYIGAQRIFGTPTLDHPQYGNCSYMLDHTYIRDIKEPSRVEIRSMSEKQKNEGPIYYMHKKTWRGQLPKSLIDAIRSFYLANAIRDLDEAEREKPRAMLINISRWVNVHSYLKEEVKKIVEADYKEINANFSKDNKRNVSNALYNDLHRIFNDYYSNCGYTWEQVCDKELILKAPKPVVIVVNGSKEAKIDAIALNDLKNGKTDTSDNKKYKKNSTHRIIAIGGLALSRGLTLDGLMTSYFYRNTCTYDVLMQMGRWFGYRPHYEKVCRIWTTNTSANWYREISEATDELKSELAHMNLLELTPSQFGIRIRRDDTALEITARNKMRKAGKCEIRSSFWGDVYETPYFSCSAYDNKINWTETINWLHAIVNRGAIPEKAKSKESYLIRDVKINDIVSILPRLHICDKNLKFKVDVLMPFINSNKQELSLWDVAVVGGTGERVLGMFPDETMVVKASTRKFDVRGDGEAFAFSHQGVVSGNNDGNIGLENPQMIIDEYIKTESIKNPLVAQQKKVNRCTWFKYVDRHPMFFIYPVRPSTPERLEPRLFDYMAEVGITPIMGYSVGIPGFGHEADTSFYYTNVVYQNNDGVIDETDEDE